jgi:hypothetical protein
MSINDFEPKGKSKKLADEGLNEEDLKKVSGGGGGGGKYVDGFDPQPDPPG